MIPVYIIIIIITLFFIMKSSTGRENNYCHHYVILRSTGSFAITKLNCSIVITTNSTKRGLLLYIIDATLESSGPPAASQFIIARIAIFYTPRTLILGLVLLNYLEYVVQWITHDIQQRCWMLLTLSQGGGSSWCALARSYYYHEIFC
jgi:hypothetical protein